MRRGLLLSILILLLGGCWSRRLRESKMSHNEMVFWSEAALIVISLLALAVVYLTRHKKGPR